MLDEAREIINVFLVKGAIEKFGFIEHCDPFAKAIIAKEKHPARVTPKPTMAEGIAIGVPMRGEEILKYTYKYNIKM